MSGEVARTTQLDHGITAIDTDYVRPLLDASHLVIEDGRAAFVDTGTNFSVPLLLDGLRSQDLDVGDVDYVFLTHVHLDHAGGAGSLMRHLPNAKAVLHPRGAPHMIDPAKLIKGAQAVYGEAAYLDMYGEIVAIAENRVIVADDNQAFSLAGRSLRTFYTQGHARHHYCLDDPASRGVFTGDSFGISYRELDTARGAFIYPTTTPVHFDPPEAHKAIELIMACEPQQLYLTHYSRVTGLQKLSEDLHRRIDDFVALVRGPANDADRTAALHASMYDYFFRELREHGCTINDEALRELLRMDVELNSMGLEFWLDHAA
ncbi:MAG: MBL fold metallo-hydrolase [Gammaproteobacteria bacterium]|nr:MBL fold metallo-hydrolase [Gammaproteobacteria bacterium]